MTFLHRFDRGEKRGLHDPQFAARMPTYRAILALSLTVTSRLDALPSHSLRTIKPEDPHVARPCTLSMTRIRNVAMPGGLHFE
ncbi:hypothetical protein [Bradyrhizobium forestalis]|uniref:hypothetical protein n=1 Tax=Bradyrhizobium forestalis TaxID=1419263 RepID=UPI0011AF2F19|nr:hypothetical protein [Bradyrhizobium forestalis]